MIPPGVNFVYPIQEVSTVDADIDKKTRRYWSLQDLAEGLHLSRGHTYRLVEGGLMLPPDIVVAPNSFGWDPARARAFGVDTERLNGDFQSIGPPPDGGAARAEELIKTKYAVTPKVYLSSWLASYAYGFKQNAVYFMRKRGGFIPADVLVASKFGWSEPRLMEYGEQTGRLDQEGIRRWVVRRTEEFGLSPDIPWVAAFVEKHPEAKLGPRLAAAKTTWAIRQAQEAADKS